MIYEQFKIAQMTFKVVEGHQKSDRNDCTERCGIVADAVWNTCCWLARLPSRRIFHAV